MRGNPYLRLRRTMARALRRAIVGSIALALLSIALAAAATTMPDRTEAVSLDQSTSLAPPSTQAVEPAPDIAAEPPPVERRAAARILDPVEPIAPALTPALDAPIVEAPPSTAAARQVGVAAIGQLAGPPLLPLSVEDRHAAAVQRAAERGDEPDVIEPAFQATLERDPVLTPSPSLAAGDVIEATVSFYYCEQGDTADRGDGGGFCGAMRDGTVVYEGAAACAFTYLGQQFRIVGDPTDRTYTCHDTGSAVHGLHRDIFFHRAADGWPWLSVVGTRVMLEIVG